MKLGRFCARPLQDKYDFMCKPFTMGGFTYATDGHIAIRLPIVPGSHAYDAAPPDFRGDKIFDEHAPIGKPHILTRHNLPEPRLVECEQCDGRARVHPCPSCKCPCFYCDAEGSIYDDSAGTAVQVFDTVVATHYFRLMLELKELWVTAPAGKVRPIPFTFQSGYLDCQGLLMPLQFTHPKDHIFRTYWSEDR